MTNESDLSETEHLLKLDQSNPRKGKRRLWLNATVLNSAILVLSAGDHALTAIQSSLNSNENLGVTTMANSAVFSLVGALLSSTLLRLFTYKQALSCCLALTVFSPLGNFYPTWATMIPASAICGFADGMLVVVREAYTALLAHRYSDLDPEVRAGQHHDDGHRRVRTQGHFFMFHFAFTNLGCTLGNLASSFMLKSSGQQNGNDKNDTSYTDFNHNSSSADINFFNETDLQLCGASYCNQDLHSDFHDVTDSERIRVYLTIAFNLGMCILASLLVIFLLEDLEARDPETEEELSARKKRKGESPLKCMLESLKATVSLYLNPYMLLILPIIVSLSASSTFWASDFSKAFITCPLGMSSVGFVMMWMGITGALASVIFGWLSSPWLRRGSFVFAWLLQMALAISLLFWTPGLESLITLCLLSAGWSFGLGAMFTLLPALVATTFRSNLEMAFANMQTWGTLATVLVFLWSDWICMDSKLYFIITLMSLGIIAIVVLEVMLHHQSKQAAAEIADS